MPQVMKHSKEEEIHVELTQLSVEAPPREESSTNKSRRRRVLDQTNFQLVFVITCMIAALMDPLFFYIPWLDLYKQCVGTNRRVKNVALMIRVFTDIPFIVDMIYQIRKASSIGGAAKLQIGAAKTKPSDYFQHLKAIASNLSWLSFTVDFLAILPIPHLLVVYVFSGARLYGDIGDRMWLNLFILAQYIPRMYVLFSLSKKFRQNSPPWVKGTFYFVMYIATGNIIGGFWYLNTVEMQLACYYWASCPNDDRMGPCRSMTMCKGDDFTYTSDLFTFVSKVCAVNSTVYDFGMYAEALKSNVGPDYGRGKLSFFMLWGLKNLSNFGTSFQTSNFMWENIFGLIISELGLVLFAYLIGNMQEIMQSSDKKKAMSVKIRKKEKELLEWMKKHGLSEELRKQIGANIKEKLKEDKNADMENLYCLPEPLYHILCMKVLRKLPGLENMDDKRLGMICHYLKPVIYAAKSVVFQVGEPLDSILFILQGTVIIYNNPHSSTSSEPMTNRVLEDGGIYGHVQLFGWALTSSDAHASLETLPVSKENVKCHTIVEGFALGAKDLKVALDNINLLDDPAQVEKVIDGTPLIHRTPGAYGGRL